MNITHLFDESLIFLKQEFSSKDEVLKFLALQVAQSGKAISEEKVYQDLLKRETEGNTVVAPYFAIPHAKSLAITKPVIAVITLKKEIVWDIEGEDSEPVKNIIFLGVPEKEKSGLFLDILAKISTLLIEEDIRDSLFQSTNAQIFIDKIIKYLDTYSLNTVPITDGYPKIVGITSCPAGLAHTYMAAESLIKACSDKNISVKIEKQSIIGAEDALTDEEIKNAELVIIAVNTHIDLNRFSGKKLYQTTASKAIKSPAQVIEEALNQATIYTGTTHSNSTTVNKSDTIFSHIMAGLSYMLPMVVASGLMLAMATVFAFSKNEAGQIINWGFDIETSTGYFLSKLHATGIAGFTLMIPVLAGFIANSIAGKPAMAPAMIGAYIANDANFLGTRAGGGFFAAIIVALIVGYFARYLLRLPWPKVLKPVAGLMFVPLISSIMICIVVVYILGTPIALAIEGMYSGLEYMMENSVGGPILLGAVLAGMIGFDFGGPVGKTAWFFAGAVFVDTVAVSGIQNANLMPQTAVNAAIANAPLGIWLASRIFKNKFTSEEKISANSAGTMAIFGISEGALPFAAAHPIQTITASVIGASLAGALVVLTNCRVYGGVGSPFGTFLGYIEQPIPHVTWIACTFAGIITTALIIGFWRKPLPKENPNNSYSI